MAEEVIDSLENMSLTVEEEETIAISDEGRLREIESCNLSLVGRFLTCKPFNKRAAKATLRRAWGLNEGLQIVEVGENLFQFKFKTEFDMERIIHDGPWTFDNQILLVQKWQKGMTAKNICLDSASLWIQIWDAPFDMVSPTVAMEVGGRLGKVEEVEKRRNLDDQNIFMRVKVALPISKPLRRGAFLASADGERTWCKFKYERLPLFCHYCGMLGHDIRHCTKHFTAAKQSGEVKCQYGDWMRASGGRSRSSPKRTTKGSVSSTREEEAAQEGGGSNTKQAEVMGTAPEKPNVNPRHEGEIGRSAKSGLHLEGHQCSPKILEDVEENLEKRKRNTKGNGTEIQGLNSDSSHVLLQNDHVQELNSSGPTDSKAKPKWTRVVRMDSGPVQTKKECPESLLGKRRIKYAEEPEGEHGVTVRAAKQGRFEDKDANHDEETARVESRPCRTQ